MKFIETWNDRYINTDKIVFIRMNYDQVYLSISEDDFEIRLTDEKNFDEDLLPWIVSVISEPTGYILRYKELIRQAQYKLDLFIQAEEAAKNLNEE